MAFNLSNSAIADGTVLIKVTGFADLRVARCKALSASITRPPRLSVTNNSNTERSKQIEVEANTPCNSSVEKTVLAQSIRAATLSCWIATPLGLPVDPDV